MGNRSFWGVIEYEVRRLRSKKSFYFMVLIALLPFVTVTIVKYFNLETHGIFPIEQSNYLWLYLYGTPRTIGGGILVSATGIAAYMWLFASLFGGDTLASDIEEGWIQVLLSKPLTRFEYIAGKVIAALGVLASVYFIGALSSLISAYIMAGSQGYAYLVIVLPIVTALSSIPIILLSAWVGGYTGSSLTGLLSGIGLYFLSNTIAGLVGFTAGPRFIQRLMDYSLLDPIKASTQTSLVTVMYLTGVHKIVFPRINGVYPVYSVNRLFTGSWVNLITSSIIIFFFIVKWFSRKSF
ncbi:MAG: ABC transporter permease [Desulfurococcales archaeon]|nr:ABC transporter permease [Desulfurococcales archaeon]